MLYAEYTEACSTIGFLGLRKPQAEHAFKMKRIETDGRQIKRSRY